MQNLVTRTAFQLLTSCQLGLPSTGPYAVGCLTPLSYPIATDRPRHLISYLIPTSSLSQRRGYADKFYAQAAKDLNQKGLDEQESQLDDAIAQEKEKQTRTPWHREGSQIPPVRRQRSAGAMTKGKLTPARLECYLLTKTPPGKLLTTPSRLLKLVLPLTTLDNNSDRKDVEPLALLVHAQQPLSYLERLIQSELPSIKNEKGEAKIPAVYFRAEDSEQDEIEPKTKTRKEEADKEEDEGLEETKFEGQTEKAGKLNRKTKKEAAELRGGPGEGGVESYSGLGREHDPAKSNERKFVRWSSSTEIGDFIRDAARGKEFAVEIEGSRKEIRVGVPSFNDRTHYLRVRLRKTSRKIMDMADVKRECDIAAHKGAQRVAMGGFGVLLGWWYVVYWLTFETDLGWDVMEPVTVGDAFVMIICHTVS